MRYSRAAVPEPAIAEIVRPLHELLGAHDRANGILADVCLDPGLENDQRFGMVFITKSEDNVAEADDLWEVIAGDLRLRSQLLDLGDPERNGVIAYDDLTVARWERVSRVGDDELSYRESEAAEPLP
jgi:hypothetical protein